jgi:hypothetical protein
MMQMLPNPGMAIGFVLAKNKLHNIMQSMSLCKNKLHNTKQSNEIMQT